MCVRLKTMHFVLILAQFLVAPFFHRRYFCEMANITLFMLHVSDIRQFYIHIYIYIIAITLFRINITYNIYIILYYIILYYIILYYIQNCVFTIYVEVRIPVTIILELCVAGIVAKI